MLTRAFIVPSALYGLAIGVILSVLYMLMSAPLVTL